MAWQIPAANVHGSIGNRDKQSFSIARTEFISSSHPITMPTEYNYVRTHGLGCLPDYNYSASVLPQHYSIFWLLSLYMCMSVCILAAGHVGYITSSTYFCSMCSHIWMNLFVRKEELLLPEQVGVAYVMSGLCASCK